MEALRVSSPLNLVCTLVLLGTKSSDGDSQCVCVRVRVGGFNWSLWIQIQRSALSSHNLQERRLFLTVLSCTCVVCMCNPYLSFVNTDSEENSKVPPPIQSLRGMKTSIVKVTLLCVWMSVLHQIFVYTHWTHSRVSPPRQRLRGKNTDFQGCCLLCMCWRDKDSNYKGTVWNRYR